MTRVMHRKLGKIALFLQKELQPFLGGWGVEVLILFTREHEILL